MNTPLDPPAHPTATDLSTIAACEASRVAWTKYRDDLRTWVALEEANVTRWLDEADRRAKVYAGGIDDATLRLARATAALRPPRRWEHWVDRRTRENGALQPFSGPEPECIRDFMAALSGAVTPRDGIRDHYFGVKVYERFHQREDHRFGYGPSHGHIVMAVRLLPPYADSDRPIPPENVDAVLRVLTAILAGNVPADALEPA